MIERVNELEPTGALITGGALTLNGEFEAAARVFRRGIDVNPRDALLRQQLAFVEFMVGNRAQAERETRIAERLLTEGAPFYTQVLAYIAVSYGQLELNEDAIRVFERLMGTEPEESALGLLEWVDLYSAIGDIDRALAYAQRVAAGERSMSDPPIAIQAFIDNRFRNPVLARPEFVALRRGMERQAEQP
jgi:tetratricopeptide (TPR) repeat protein